MPVYVNNGDPIVLSDGETMDTGETRFLPAPTMWGDREPGLSAAVLSGELQIDPTSLPAQPAPHSTYFNRIPDAVEAFTATPIIKGVTRQIAISQVTLGSLTMLKPGRDSIVLSTIAGVDLPRIITQVDIPNERITVGTPFGLNSLVGVATKMTKKQKPLPTISLTTRLAYLLSLTGPLCALFTLGISANAKWNSLEASFGLFCSTGTIGSGTVGYAPVVGGPGTDGASASIEKGIAFSGRTFWWVYQAIGFATFDEQVSTAGGTVNISDAVTSLQKFGYVPGTICG